MTNTPWLWLETFIPAEATNELSAFVMTARAYYVQNQTMKGYHYPPTETPATDPAGWWLNKKAPFKAAAAAGCHIYKNTTKTPTAEFMAQLPTPTQLAEARTVDVYETWPANVPAPLWFRVWPDTAHASAAPQWVPAEETTEPKA